MLLVAKQWRYNEAVKEKLESQFDTSDISRDRC